MIPSRLSPANPLSPERRGQGEGFAAVSDESLEITTGRPSPRPAGRSLRETRPAVAAGANVSEGRPLVHPRAGRAVRS